MAEAVPAPLNVLAAPELPPIAELKRLGVKRLSTGSAPARATLTLARQMASELLEQGTYGSMTDSTIPYGDVNRLLS